jgi:GT2 family glycosyltransferase
MIPIIVCSLGSTSLSVLEASIKSYSPETPLIAHQVARSSFGECYNQALTEAFKQYDEVIIANDDVVITPATISTLLADVSKLKPAVDKLGFVATMADNVRLSQNIRQKLDHRDQLQFGKWASEHVIKQVPVIAPIFAWYSKQAFTEVQFPPITWYSDDVICYDLEQKGYKNFVSTAYVHHVGSNTIGTDYDKLRSEAMPWIQKHRPEFVSELEKRLGKKITTEAYYYHGN